MGVSSSLKYLYLHSNQLQGPIAELSNFTLLEGLDLGGNKFNKSILSYIKRFSSLKYLSLENNQLRGSIDVTELNTLGNLETLYLDRNEISGFVTSTGEAGFLQLSKLEELDLSGNQFNNSIWSSLRALPSLKHLDLEENHLKGPVDMQALQDLTTATTLEELDMIGSFLDEEAFRAIGAVTSLKKLFLWEVDGRLPTTGLPALENLEVLDLSDSALNNSFLILKTVGNMSSLKDLRLDNCGLSGTIPSTFGGLENLRSIDLSNNNLQIPISLRPFFNLTKLKFLHVGNNEIYGETEDYNVTPKFNLEYLDLSGHASNETFIPKFLYHQNSLQGVDLSHAITMKSEFPHWLLVNNTQLRSLHLANNSLSGPLQLPMHPHMNLTDLDISINFFHGQIPGAITTYLPRLKWFNTSKNHFRNGIMDWMYSLTVLDLSNNELQDGMPEFLTPKQCSLSTLLLSNNSITGVIPDSLSNCSSLRQMDVSNNRLSGKIPEWMGNMDNLEFLSLSQNEFTGTLPNDFNPPSLQYVYLSKNNLQGSLEKAFHSCRALVTLDLSHNKFSGGIPDWIDLLSQLSFLVLSYNKLAGEMPIQLCKLEQLSILDLSGNNFFGPILPCLRPSSNWYRISIEPAAAYAPEGQQQSIEVTAKNASYAYPSSILQYMSGIDLSCNNFTGEIPHELGLLGNIKLLNLSHNSLTGEIPPTFSKLREIETLDLSFNNLNGTIPPQLIGLYSLSAFSVAHNNLSGKTPERVAQFGTFEEGSYRDNPYLCGPPLNKSCSETVEPQGRNATTSGEGEEEGGFMDMGALYVTFVASYAVAMVATCVVLYINPRWRRALFYFLEQKFFNCYYFLLDNVPLLPRLGLS
ncbi:hypothetical protein Tsubulata_045509 [Turnera subulata]|uniref:Leucine-rich repeat-containing N-terminal plant-type domain-containing protein n=1 Tax=Turnera subulata TaxID=218843 RepID=A0A9Q0JJK2_9ROSI|nr:hypothetical protein Tsubulata_045509 [Turnera subulata]